jgi:hypothetical protein
MSMPYPVKVVIISENIPFGGEIALMLSAVLDHAFSFATPASSQSQRRDEFLDYCKTFISNRRLDKLINELQSPYLINAEKIDLWLALDEAGEKVAREHYEKTGDFSNKGRLSFSERVVRCSFTLPDISSTQNIKKLHQVLTEHLTPWKDRVWKVMCDYS